VIEFLWSSILQYDLDDDAAMFCFQYQRQNKAARWVKIFSNHVSRRYDLFSNAVVFSNLEITNQIAQPMVTCLGLQ
jgi:hypothetical protein